MNVLRARSRPKRQPSNYSVALRQRVEKLEAERIAACGRRDRDAVDLIDYQIKQVVSEWTDSMAAPGESEVKKSA